MTVIFFFLALLTSLVWFFTYAYVVRAWYCASLAKMYKEPAIFSRQETTALMQESTPMPTQTVCIRLRLQRADAAGAR